MSASFPRVLVIGGGVAGLSVAFRLMRRGAGVRVIDAGQSGASKAAAGMLPPALEAFGLDGAHPDFADLLFAARARWSPFAEALASDCGAPAQVALGYRVAGTLATAQDAAGQARLAGLAEAGAALGESVDILDAAGAHSLAPGLSNAVLGGIHFPKDALVEPPLLMAALTDVLIKGGAQIRTGHAAIQITPHSVGAELRLRNGETEQADAIVIAPGWTRARLAPELASLFPIKGQILTVMGGRNAPKQMLRGDGVYLAPRADGRVEIGATNETGVETRTIEPEAIIKLQRAAVNLFPALARAPVLASRAGIRPGSPDHAPLLGASALGAQVFLAAGLHRNGILLAPLVADVLADAVLGESQDSASQFWLDRFAAGRFAGL